MNAILLTLFSLFVCAFGNVFDRFEDWVNDFQITFKNNEHMQSIYNNWVENDKFIEFSNNQNLTYSLGHNQFSGMTNDEYQEYLGFLSFNMETQETNLRGIDESFLIFKTLKNQYSVYDEIFYDSLPESVDWVTSGAVTNVKDQGQCGSCWSFSTTGALEGAYFNKYDILESFSEQQLVDCDNWKNGGRDHGCNGGLMDNAFTWISKNGGLCSESDYPYVAGTTKSAGTCKTTCKNVDYSDIISYIDVEPNSDNAMMMAISKQPISIAIEADQTSFQFYKSGVFTASCGTNLDHGVLAVGYGSENGMDYYLVKNSWGTSWGMDGYIMLGRGSSYNDGAGQCGMLMQGSYPIV